MVGLSSSSFFLSKIFDSVSSLKQSFSDNGSADNTLKTKNETTLHPSWFWLTVLLVSSAMPTTTKDLVPAFGMKETKTAGKSKSDNRLSAGSGNSRGGQAMDFRYPSSSFRGDLFTHQDPDNLPKRIGAKLNEPQQRYTHPEPLPHAHGSLGNASFHPNLGSHAPHSKPFPNFEHLELPIPNLVPGETPVVLPVQTPVANPVAAPVTISVTGPTLVPGTTTGPVPFTLTGPTLIPGTGSVPFTVTGAPMGIAIKAEPPHVTHIAGTEPVPFQVQQEEHEFTNLSFQYPFKSYLGPRSQDLRDRLEVVLDEINETVTLNPKRSQDLKDHLEVVLEEINEIVTLNPKRSQDLKDRLEVVLEEVNEIVTLNPKRSQDLKDHLEVVLEEINEIVTLVPRPTLRMTGKQTAVARMPELDVSNLKLFMERIEPEGAALANMHIPTLKGAAVQRPAVGTQLQQPAERIAESVEPKLEQNLHFGKPIKDLAKKPTHVKDSPFKNETRRNLFPDLKIVKDFPKLDIVEEFLEPVNLTFFPSNPSKKFTQSSKVHDLKLPPLEIETSETVTRQTINLIDQLKLELNEETILPTISLPMLKKPDPKYNYDDLFNEFNEPTVYPDIVETIEIPDLKISSLPFHGPLKDLHDDRENPMTFHHFERAQTTKTIDLVEPLHMVTSETINLIEQLKVEVNESIHKPLIHRRPLYPTRNVLVQEEHTFSSLVADRTTNLLSSAASVFDALTDMFTFASLGSSISQASKAEKERDLNMLVSEVDEEIVPQKHTDEEQRIFAHEQDILAGIKGKQAEVSDLSKEQKDWLSSAKSTGRLNYKIKPITIVDLPELSTTTEIMGVHESRNLYKEFANGLKSGTASASTGTREEITLAAPIKSPLTITTTEKETRTAIVEPKADLDLGPTPQDLLKMGYSRERILGAGYTVDELLKANFEPALRAKELEKAGYVLTIDELRQFVKVDRRHRMPDNQINQLSYDEASNLLGLVPISKEGATPSVSTSVTMAQTLEELIDTVALDKLKVALSDATGMAQDAFDNFGEDTLRTMAKTLPDMDVHLANAGAPLEAPSGGLKTVVSDEDFATFDDPADLLAYGEYTREAIAQANYGFDRLADAGFTVQELANAGATAQDLKDAGFIASDLATIYSLADLADAGYDLAALIAAGFTGEELEAENYLHNDIIAHGGVFGGASVASSATGSAVATELDIDTADLDTLKKAIASVHVHGMSYGLDELNVFDEDDLRTIAKDMRNAGAHFAAASSLAATATVEDIDTMMAEMGVDTSSTASSTTAPTDTVATSPSSDIDDLIAAFGWDTSSPSSTPVVPKGSSVPTTATGEPPVDDLSALAAAMGIPVTLTTPTFNSLQDVEKWAMKSQENFSKVYGLTGALTRYAKVFDDYMDSPKNSKRRAEEERNLRFALNHIENQFGTPIALGVLNKNLFGETFAKLTPQGQAEFIRNHKDYKDHIWDFYGAVLGKDTSPEMTQLIANEVDKLFGKSKGNSLVQARQNEFPMESRAANIKAIQKLEKKLTDAERDEVEIYLNAINDSKSSDEIKGFMDMIKGAIGENRGKQLVNLLGKQFADLKGQYIQGGETGNKYFMYDIDENNGVAAGIPHPKNPKLRILELSDEMVAGFQPGDNLTVATTLGEAPEDDFIRQVIAAPSKPIDELEAFLAAGAEGISSTELEDLLAKSPNHLGSVQKTEDVLTALTEAEIKGLRSTPSVSLADLDKDLESMGDPATDEMSTLRKTLAAALKDDNILDPTRWNSNAVKRALKVAGLTIPSAEPSKEGFPTKRINIGGKDLTEDEFEKLLEGLSLEDLKDIQSSIAVPKDKEPEVVSKKVTSAPSISTAAPDLSDEGLKFEKAKGKASLDAHLQKEKNPERRKDLKGAFENDEYLYKEALKGNVDEARKILAHVESVPGLGIDAAEYLFDSFVLDAASKLPEAQRSAYIQQTYEEEYLQNTNSSVLPNVIMGKVRTLFGEDAGDKLADTYKSSLISQAPKDFEAKDIAGKKSSVTAMPAPTEKLKKKGKKQPLPVSKKEDKDS